MKIHPKIVERVAAEYVRIYRVEGLEEASRYAERVVKHKKVHHEQLRKAVKQHIRRYG